MRSCGLLVVALLVAMTGGGMVTATAALTAPPGIGSSANISGEVGVVEGGPTIDSFNEDAPFPANSWTANDTATDPDSTAQSKANGAFGVTSSPTSTTATASGTVDVQYSVPVRRVTSGSVYTARFEVSEPTQYVVSGSLTSFGQVNPGIFCCSSARVTLEPDIFEQDAQNGQSVGVGGGGILQPGDYSLTVLASAGIGFGAAIPPDVSGGASFNVTLVLSPPGPPPPPLPIVVQGGPEDSNLNLQVDTTASGGVKYTFNDAVPLQIADVRCSGSGVQFFCELPAETEVRLGMGDGDDTVTLTGTRPFEQLTANGEGGDDTLPAAPKAHGGDGDDTITVHRCTTGPCELHGDDGSDVLFGGPGNDMLFPGDDSDLVKGEGGTDTVAYPDAAARVEIFLSLGTANDGGGDPDTIETVENAIGSAFGDVLVGDAGQNRLEGGGGNDSLDGLELGDDLIGGPDHDRVGYRNHALSVHVTLNDGQANDGSPGEADLVEEGESLAGTDGDDTLVGTAEANTLEGFAGDDTLVPGAGADEMAGGDDSDTVDYSGAPGRIVANLFIDDIGEATGTSDVVEEIENVVGSAFDDILLGDDDASSPNRLEGGPGDDELDGLRGPDEMIGGPDVDRVSYFIHSAGADGLGAIADLANPNLDAGVSGEGDRISEVENLVGSRFDDTFGGNGDANKLEGGDGNDGLFGLGGNDELLGEEGEDFIEGQDGDDLVDGGLDGDLLAGGAGIDIAYYGDRTANVSVDLRPGGPSGTEGEVAEGDDVDSSFENVAAGTGFDILIGNDSGNTLEGGDGNDAIEGRGGTDVLDGQEGDDFLFARDGLLDHVFCGPGDDDLSADPLDNHDECETINLPATPPPPPLPPPPPPPALPPPANTPAGVNVTVNPVDATTLTFPVEVTFGAVTTPGMTIVFSSRTGPIVPAGFQLGTPPVYYFISTNAAIVPPIRVCIDMTGITFPTQPQALMHFDQVLGWVDITRPRPPVPPKICGESNTLSPFAVMSPARTVRAVRCVVPNVKGKTLAAARKAIVRGRCSLGRVRRSHSARVKTGRVISQRPAPKTRLARGAKVNLVLSRGKRRK